MNTWNDLSIKEKAAMMKVAIQNGITTLPEIREAYNKFAEGGDKDNNPTPVTTGGAGYVPNTDYSGLFTKLSNLYNYAKTYVSNKINGTGEGEFIDLSDKNVSRINSDTDNVSTILTNEFIEGKHNTIRRKQDFVNTQDTLLGDRGIPLSDIATFYGVEDGKLKAGPINTFNDSTVIVPNRAKNVGRIVHYEPSVSQSAEYKNALDSLINEYNQEHGYSPTFMSRVYNGGIPFISGSDPNITLAENIGRDKATEVRNKLSKKVEHLNQYEPSYVVTEAGDTIKDYRMNASPKVLFADENGNAAFVSNLKANADKLNAWLEKNPAYPVMVDNGRYAAYMTNFPNAEVYGGLNRPDDMFIIGTTKAYGGPLVQLANRYEEGGPEDDKVYYPPQSVLDNIAENNGKYMITGTPPFATKYETAWPYIKSSSMLAGKLNQVMKSNMNKAGKYIVKKLPEKYRNLAEQGVDAVKRTLLGWGPGVEENYGSPVMSKFPAFIKSFERQYEDKKAYGGLLP